MRIRCASERGQGEDNEDRASWGTDWAFVLDGATAPPDVETGCRHGVRWLVTTLASALSTELDARPRPLADTLAAAIGRTRAAHAHTCDLGNPDSPSSTVALARALPGAPELLEYLVLADSTLLVPGDGGTVRVLTDDRLDHLPGGRPYSAALVRSARNAPGGFWVAGAADEAAYRAVTGTVRAPGGRFALLTDGCSRLVERFGHTWKDLFDHLDRAGPSSLIAWVRAEERRDGARPGKRHDDATALVSG